MKSLLSTFCAALLFLTFFSTAFAATVTTEPTLPADIEAWEKQGPITCTKFPGKTIIGMKYRQETEDSLRSIIIFTLNGQKIDQREFIRVGESAAVRMRYVRNSAQNNWYMYEEAENNVAGVRMLAELGLTSEEVASCNE